MMMAAALSGLFAAEVFAKASPEREIRALEPSAGPADFQVRGSHTKGRPSTCKGWRFKGSSQAKRATRRGGNHAKTAWA